MTDPIAFALACLALLSAPGPTNTLLATSGATGGFMRSLPLILAEFCGYSLAILAMALLIAPLLQVSPLISVVLRLACGAYLIWSAVELWREGSDALTSSEPVSFRRVFLATLLNPKAIVFALVIIPHLGEQLFLAAAPYLIGLAIMAASVALCWISAGALIGAGARGRFGAGAIRRTGASVLGLFGLILSSSVLPFGIH